MFPVGGIFCGLPRSIKEIYKEAVELRQIGAALWSRTRKFETYILGQYAYFYQK